MNDVIQLDSELAADVLNQPQGAVESPTETVELAPIMRPDPMSVREFADRYHATAAANTTPVYREVMIDFESFSLDRHYAHMIAVGWRFFNLEDAPATRGAGGQIALDASRPNGYEIDRDTVMWWMRPEQDAARRFIHEGMEIGSTERWISSLVRQFEQHKTLHVWARGPQFDLQNLQRMVRDVFGDAPPESAAGMIIESYNWRDSRSVTQLMGPVYKRVADDTMFRIQGIKHLPLTDVDIEIAALKAVWQTLQAAEDDGK